ncbi:hypothetical protein SAMN05443245_0310 [Paraburkholderia fungorum]|uniref:Uncharacterized protein n=1 Tax=Paraburkholderia fungorum TaxID=134537 RepID=A0A1H0YW04_9BURK|nr:hypothetical protein [Paraburkholderia fungorum]SDQ19314.1 hypothetical protein SAMN05443245_0310 [Paraburkholderia fungorum]
MTILGGTNPTFWEMNLFKLSLIGLFLSFCCAGSYAQTDGGDHESIQTAAGTLSIVKVEHIKADGVTFNASLDGAKFDQLYGSRYTYYTDSAGADSPATRVVVQDFIGGFSDTSSVSLYDFRRKPPVALPISGKLDVDDVRWTDSAVLLSANGKWYSFSRNKLSRSHDRWK